MSIVRIIGIGSPFGNDTIGWRVIEKLKQHHLVTTLWSERIDLISTDRPGINLVKMLEGANFVILVDAILDNQRHNEVIRVNPDQCLDETKSISSHNLDVSSALTLANKLGLLPEKMLLIGLGVNAATASLINDLALDSLTNAITTELEEHYKEQTIN